MFRQHSRSTVWLLTVLLIGLTATGCGEDGAEGFVNWMLSSTGFEQVSVANGTDREISGTVRITDPNGGEVLSEQFHLGRGERNVQFNLSAADDTAFATYQATFAEPGRYGVSIELDQEVAQTRSLQDTVEITAPEKQRLLITLDPTREPPVHILRLPDPEEKTDT